MNNESPSDIFLQGKFSLQFLYKEATSSTQTKAPGRCYFLMRPTRALARILPCKHHMSSFKDETLGSVSKHTNSPIVDDTSYWKKNKRYSFVISSQANALLYQCTS